MNMLLYSKKKKTQYFILPICANYTVIHKDADYSTNHIHPVYHFMIVTAGEGKILSDNQTYVLKEKDIVVVHPNTKHVFSSDRKLGMTYFTFNFYLLPYDAYIQLSSKENWYTEENYFHINQYAETAPLSDIFDFNMSDIYMKFNGSNWDNILTKISNFSNTSVEFYDNMISKWFNYSPLNIDTYCNYSTKFLWDLYSILLVSNTDLKTDNQDPLLARIVNFLEDNIYEKYSLQTLAAQLNYSSIYLCSYFSKHTGMTINDYFNRLKISKACSYLRTTAKSITDISSILNFSSPNHFSSNFSKVKGVSPKYYRKHLEIN